MTHHEYDAASVHGLLAHRYPVLLVDRIDVIEPGRHVVGWKRLSADEWWAGADPAAQFPSVLVLEALAQASGALIEGLMDGTENAVAYFMAANRVRFRNAARAGDELTLDISLRQWRRGVCRTYGVARLPDGAVVASAELTTVVRGMA